MIIFKIDIQTWRSNKKLSQQKLASMAEMSQSYLNEIENNLKIPSLPMLEKISTALGVCLNMLIVPDKPKCKSCGKK